MSGWGGVVLGPEVIDHPVQAVTEGARSEYAIRAADHVPRQDACCSSSADPVTGGRRGGFPVPPARQVFGWVMESRPAGILEKPSGSSRPSGSTRKRRARGDVEVPRFR